MEKKKFTQPQMKVVNMAVEQVIASSVASGVTINQLSVADDNKSILNWNN